MFERLFSNGRQEIPCALEKDSGRQDLVSMSEDPHLQTLPYQAGTASSSHTPRFISYSFPWHVQSLIRSPWRGADSHGESCIPRRGASERKCCRQGRYVTCRHDMSLLSRLAFSRGETVTGDTFWTWVTFCLNALPQR